MFQGPPLSLLHHRIAFDESVSRIMLHLFVALDAKEMDIARWMTKNFAQLISMNGIEDENKHMKFPWWFRSTPPMAEHNYEMFTDASIFHLTWSISSGIHNSWGTEIEATFKGEDLQLYSKQDGFRWISIREYEKLSHQPVIHHPNLRRMRSLRLLKMFDNL